MNDLRNYQAKSYVDGHDPEGCFSHCLHYTFSLHVIHICIIFSSLEYVRKRSCMGDFLCLWQLVRVLALSWISDLTFSPLSGEHKHNVHMLRFY